MFYSHTFLARKGPLGTVWCAAHLQHRLKKSHYTSTDITSTVDRIMFPEVPIALRMSSHLLLGVVRIYSKQVDYLYQDYNVFLISLRKAFSSIEINLPHDATHAPFHSVTLPETFELDAINLDYDFYNDGNPDTNLKSLDEITLSCDQIPTGTDPYITINFDKDVLGRSLSLDGVSESRTTSVEEEVAPPEKVDHGVRSKNPSPVHIDDTLPEVIREIEGLRESIPVWTDPQHDVILPDTYMEEQISKDKEPATTFVEETIFDQEVRISPLHSPVPVRSPVSDHAADIMFSNNSVGHGSLNLALNPSPVLDKPKGKLRKRKQQFDEATVLTNKVMKAALDNYNDIRRKRKTRPSSDLDVWRSNNKFRKENIFSEPLITGIANNLRDISGDNFISSKPHLKATPVEPTFVQNSPHHETSFSPAPQAPELTNDHLEKIETLRNYEGPVDNYSIPDNSFSSPRERNDFTPGTVSSMGSTQKCTTRGTTSTGTVGSDTRTPLTEMEDYPGFENPCLSAIPEDIGSAEVDDLNFLASEDYTPSNFQRTEGFGSLSGTTRKVAQYLKEKFSPISEDLNGELSLNELLEGKTRKVCARMLFETLVLKSGQRVDVQQEEAYRDIKLKLTPQLFKDQN